jgi:ankyrin repeat protein
METIRFLLDAGANPNAVGTLENSALQIAMRYGSLDSVRLLCERGANPELETTRMASVLSDMHLLRPDDWKEILAYLFDRGLRVQGSDGQPNLYLRETLDGGHFSALKELLISQSESRPKGWNQIHEMLVRGSAADLREMRIEPGSLKEAVGRYHYTPFLLAVAMGDPDKAEILLKSGASMLETGWYERSALHVAVEGGQAGMISWLLDRGLPIEITDEGGGTPLMHACMLNRCDGVAVLLERGASTCCEGHLKGPIHRAESLEVTRLLVERGGVEINEVDPCGDWPLKNAAFVGDYEWVEWLLNHGAEVDLTSTGETALHKAVFVDAREVARLLLERGADPNSKDVDNCTPFFSVRSREMVELLRSFGGNPPIWTSLSGPLTQWVKDPLILELF